MLKRYRKKANVETMPILQIGVAQETDDDWIAVMQVDPLIDSLPLEVRASSLETALQLIGNLLDGYESELWAALQGEKPPHNKQMN